MHKRSSGVIRTGRSRSLAKPVADTVLDLNRILDMNRVLDLTGVTVQLHVEQPSGGRP